MTTNRISAKELADLIQSDDGITIKDWVDPYTHDSKYIFEGWFDFTDFIDNSEGVDVHNLGNLKLVKEHGGEGEGDSLWFVFRLREADGTERFFRMNGWWQSYVGGEYDGDLYEVKPIERTVTFYE